MIAIESKSEVKRRKREELIICLVLSYIKPNLTPKFWWCFTHFTGNS